MYVKIVQAVSGCKIRVLFIPVMVLLGKGLDSCRVCFQAVNKDISYKSSYPFNFVKCIRISFDYSPFKPEYIQPFNRYTSHKQ